MLPDKPKYASKSHTFLKGEAFVAALLANGFSYEKLVLERTGSFAKSYHKDIEDVKATTDDQDNQVIQIKVNRDSIYDRLPEGLFHQPRSAGSAAAAVGQMVTEYRRFREEEKAARKFFQPIEHELFRYAAMVEQEERELLWGLLSGDVNNTFAQFWQLDAGLPAAPLSILVRMMPWVHLIKGNKALCAKALEMMLGTPVSVRQQVIEEHPKDDDSFTLGVSSLSVDSVAGMSLHEPAVSWVFDIKELEGTEISAFMSDAPYGRFLQQFIDIFIPIEIDAVFEYEVQKSEVDEPILGYSLTL